MRKKPLTIGCGTFLLIVASAIGFLGWAMFGDDEVYVAGASKHMFAPLSAKEIDYYERQDISGVVLVTYLVGEEDFRNFAAQQGWELVPKSEIPFESGVMLPSQWQSGVYVHSRKKSGACLFYEVRRGNGGGITVVYDLANTRAIINKSNR